MFGTKVLSRLFQPKPKANPAAPEGTVAYAIGDVHGRADLLAPMLERILGEYAALGDDRRKVIVFLGDYVDRGPSSREVIGALIELARLHGVESRFLKGNHDQTFLEFLSNPAVGVEWCDFGGRETIASYGVAPPRGRVEPETWETTRAALAAAVPEGHVAFLRRLELTFELGDYFFAHAGARPGVPLEAQSEEDLLWIRQPFLGDGRRFSKIVVHGHTPAEEPYADHRRIGLDTGAYATGVLTALRLEGRKRRLVQTRRLGQGAIEILEGDI